MGKKILFLLFLFTNLILLSFNSFASNVMHTFNDDDWTRIVAKTVLNEKGFYEDFTSGPGYEILKQKYGTDDFFTILFYEDLTYGIIDPPTNLVIAPKDVKLEYCDEEFKLMGRDKAIDRKLEAERKKLDKEEEKAEKKRQEEEEAEQYKNGSKKVTIHIWVDKDHPENPTPGTNYTKTFTIYTDTDKLGDAMREAGITDDIGFIEVIDGINGSYTIENGLTGWKGYSWMLYEGGSQTSVGADMLNIHDGSNIRWKAEYLDMSW